MDKESWFTAAEAQQLGLIDDILPSKVDKASNSVVWDLSAFENAPTTDTLDTIELDNLILEEQPVVIDTAADIAARQRHLAVALLN
jgi:hypothetical protein